MGSWKTNKQSLFTKNCMGALVKYTFGGVSVRLNGEEETPLGMDSTIPGAGLLSFPFPSFLAHWLLRKVHLANCSQPQPSLACWCVSSNLEPRINLCFSSLLILHHREGMGGEPQTRQRNKSCNSVHCRAGLQPSSHQGKSQGLLLRCSSCPQLSEHSEHSVERWDSAQAHLKGP